jgi:hypothetical protein
MHLYEWADEVKLVVCSRRMTSNHWVCSLLDKTGTTQGWIATGRTQEAALANLAQQNQGRRFGEYQVPVNLFYAGHDIQ